MLIHSMKMIIQTIVNQLLYMEHLKGISLVSIPSGLFNNQGANLDFTSCFENCISLTSIPDGLFDSNTLVTNFDSTFRNCSSISNIDQTLFNSNTSVNNFNSVFEGVTLNSVDYGGLLINLEANNNNNNVPFHGGFSTYPLSSATARAALISDHSWTITDGGAE